MAAGESTSGSLLTWSVENWLTVTLMALISFGLWGAAQAWYQKRQGNS